MGEVYRARDTKLDRDVAVKILPEAFAVDADRVARFQREAKTLAALNHPNIGAIYGLEQADGVNALVMELVEGEDLSQRIGAGRCRAYRKEYETVRTAVCDVVRAGTQVSASSRGLTMPRVERLRGIFGKAGGVRRSSRP